MIPCLFWSSHRIIDSLTGTSIYCLGEGNWGQRFSFEYWLLILKTKLFILPSQTSKSSTRIAKAINDLNNLKQPKAGMVEHTWNASTQVKAKTSLQVQGQAGPHSKTISQNRKKKNQSEIPMDHKHWSLVQQNKAYYPQKQYNLTKNILLLLLLQKVVIQLINQGFESSFLLLLKQKTDPRNMV